MGTSPTLQTSTSYFEHVGVAGFERLNTQTLDWIFSGACKALSCEDRIELLTTMFDLPFQPTDIIRTVTEYLHMDLVIETDTCILILENKLKSDEHGGQLAKYKKKLHKSMYGKDGRHKHYVYLTLLGDQSRTIDEWIPVAYDTLHTTLNDFVNRKEKDGLSNMEAPYDFLILKGYVESLGRLLKIKSEFLNNHIQFDNVFLHGHLRKADKHDNAEKLLDVAKNSEFFHSHSFIFRNNLETIFQRFFYKALLERIEMNLRNLEDYHSHHIGESHGVALLDVRSKHGFTHNGKAFYFTIQFQRGTVKLTVQVVSETGSKRPQLMSPFFTPLINHATIKGVNGIADYKRLNKPRKHGYVSVSKELLKEKGAHWYQQSIEDIANLLQREIEYGFTIARQLSEILPHASMTGIESDFSQN